MFSKMQTASTLSLRCKLPPHIQNVGRLNVYGHGVQCYMHVGTYIGWAAWLAQQSITILPLSIITNHHITTVYHHITIGTYPLSYRGTSRVTAVFTSSLLTSSLADQPTEHWAWQLHTNGVSYSDKLRMAAVLAINLQWFYTTDLPVAWQPMPMSFWAHCICGHTADMDR